MVQPDSTPRSGGPRFHPEGPNSYLRTLGIVRISKDTENFGLGVRRQEKDVRRHAKERGLNLVEVVTDNRVSATVADRATYQRALKGIAAGEFQVVLLGAFDRLTRSITEVVGQLLPLMVQSGAKLMTSDGQVYDCSSPEGQAHFVQAGMGAWLEWLKMQRRSLDFHRHQASDGWVSGKAPFGYTPVKVRDEEDRERTLWVEVPEEADYIRDAVARLLAGQSFVSILWEWRARWPTRFAGRKHDDKGRLAGRQMSGVWTMNSLRRYLQMPSIAGMRQHGSEQHPGRWSGIITVDQHQQLVALFSGRPKRVEARLTLASSLPGTILRCACGAPLTRFRRLKTEKFKYACQRKNSVASCGGVGLDFTMLEQVIGRALVIAIHASPSMFPGLEDDIQVALERELIGVDAEIARLEDKWVADTLSHEGYQRNLKRLQDQRTDVDARLQAHRRDDMRLSMIRQLRDESFDEVAWDAMTVARRRQLVTDLIERIQVTKRNPRGRRDWDADPDRYRANVRDRIKVLWRR